ncbi:helix-turn-helix transcriptional regulator [Aminobacter aganoensis]|uniref:Helix-turn-helix domain-containing protein n=1 Tax=Aminobacter aganoensis TaxID=83264 RepID=A0A7X0FAW0_9HYPH|nr:hypothetical protein [Aminobacter aganoensis]MBB6356319.1 hypothetical protein [Aminobacter aganoensis]
MSNPELNQIFLNEHQLAERQQRSVKTIRNQRIIGGGVPFCRFGRSVRYRLSDVIDWGNARVVSSTSEPKGGASHG